MSLTIAPPSHRPRRLEGGPLPLAYHTRARTLLSAELTLCELGTNLAPQPLHPPRHAPAGTYLAERSAEACGGPPATAHLCIKHGAVGTLERSTMPSGSPCLVGFACVARIHLKQTQLSSYVLSYIVLCQGMARAARALVTQRLTRFQPRCGASVDGKTQRAMKTSKSLGFSCV
jgi:hypothetical protein